MKTNIALLGFLLVGCQTHAPTSSDTGSNPGGDGPIDDGGVGGGPDGGPGGGLDGGGPDAGVACTSPNAVETIPLECRVHIPETETPVYANNPPVSGPHYEIWARWQKYETVVPRGYWVHNLEHGGVVFLYRPDAPQSVKDALNRVYDAIPLEQDCVDLGIPHNRVVLTPDPLLDVPWAVTVSGPESAYCVGNGFRIKSDCVADEAALVNFAVTRRNNSIESDCAQGAYPYLP